MIRRREIIVAIVLLWGNSPATQAALTDPIQSSPEFSFCTQTVRGEAKPLFEVIRPGLTRAEVESILQERDYGLQYLTKTLYTEKPGYLIEVPYDEAGGLWSPHNKVNGMARRIHGRWRRVRSSKI